MEFYDFPLGSLSTLYPDVLDDFPELNLQPDSGDTAHFWLSSRYASSAVGDQSRDMHEVQQVRVWKHGANPTGCENENPWTLGKNI